MRQLAAASRLSAAAVARLESGSAGSLEAYARLAVALGLRPEIVMAAHQRRRSTTVRAADPVHSAMGELEAARLRGRGLHVAVDEPYQHFQFAGRADVVAWDTERLALLHLENRTRFPDLQAAAGAFNAKRAYLGQALAERLGIRGWRHETHVIVALWSAEVLHVVRLRRASFEALCPDSADAFDAWWGRSGNAADKHAQSGADGMRPGRVERLSTFVLLDPAAPPRARTWVDLVATSVVRPRHHGYAAAANALRAIGRA